MHRMPFDIKLSLFYRVTAKYYSTIARYGSSNIKYYNATNLTYVLNALRTRTYLQFQHLE